MAIANTKHWTKDINKTYRSNECHKEYASLKVEFSIELHLFLDRVLLVRM